MHSLPENVVNYGNTLTANTYVKNHIILRSSHKRTSKSPITPHGTPPIRDSNFYPVIALQYTCWKAPQKTLARARRLCDRAQNMNLKHGYDFP